ncbi:hypothetical protein [Ktedonospora formicarum]|uniref:hypothetical protein n=1 Tax=Ktedonospora formicarum TaxID=2778364 RepID=UPI001C68F062|nr:hypothetical protein [Ktedonospora formicarum]
MNSAGRAPLCVCFLLNFLATQPWNGSETAKPRQVSVLLHPLSIGGEPLLWRDWSWRIHRRACMQLLRHQRVEVQREPDITPGSPGRAARHGMPAGRSRHQSSSTSLHAKRFRRFPRTGRNGRVKRA